MANDIQVLDLDGLKETGIRSACWVDLSKLK